MSTNHLWNVAENIKAYIHGRSLRTRSRQVQLSTVSWPAIGIFFSSLSLQSSFMRFSNFLIYCLENVYCMYGSIGSLAHCYGYFTLRLNITFFVTFDTLDRFFWIFFFCCSYFSSLFFFIHRRFILYIHSEKWDMILIYLRFCTDIHHGE